MSSSNAVAIRYIEETTYGTTPTTGAWETARVVSESLGGTPETVISEESRADRMDSDQIQVNLQSGGNISGELSEATWDAFLEAGMCDQWATGTADELNIGTNDKSFSIEKEFTDHNTPYFVALTGQRVGTMSLSFAFGSIITTEFTFAGNGVTTGTATAVTGTATVNAANTNQVMNASSNVNSILVDGVAATQCIQQIDLNLDNNLEGINCIGSASPSDQRKYGASVSGSITFYFDDSTQAIYDKVISNTDFSLQWVASDGTNSYTFFVPRARLSGEPPSKGGRNQEVFLTVDFNGLVDTATTNTALRITRS